MNKEIEMEVKQSCDCPSYLPKKFWDEQKGEARLEPMARSYREMERKVGAGLHKQAPNHHSEYCVECKSDLFGANEQVNMRMHQAGFSNEQVQLVYDLAHEALEPMVAEIFAHVHGQYQVDRLCDKFGGEDRWMETARQLQTWGKQKFGPDALEAMSSSYDGVMSLYDMMTKQEGEPEMGRLHDHQGMRSEEDVRKLMRDPKYWRDRDPATVERVCQGFKSLYPG
ncbi:conserved hypothetical protein [Candidatus Terasakiella magnetica]|uniref:Uncharacterized protein n=1 Tax=Candidatus Terasakiella magnetica TaxID=1867952 RepID=A0A1C3RDM3_9PROT|nr:hypothetical protein [Candidatus Terasakiella magnetica]SCA55387.1 conserved hypothetical protein [Candidatus Terasakiella magnetica]